MIRTVAFVVAALSWLGCGGAPVDPASPDVAEPPEFCVVDENVKATAKPKPVEEGCIDGARYEENATACQSGDANACYQAGVCVKMQMMGRDGEMPADEWEKHFKASIDAMRRSCEAGIARACLFRAGVIQEELDLHPARADADTLRRQLCEDSLRTCQLGDDDGCTNCSMFDCQALLAP